VASPVSMAFENTRKLLKQDGIFIFTVPYTKDVETKEHFPNLHKYEIQGKEGNRVLKNITEEGVEETFNDLIFHGGDGSTLELRVFSESSLIKELNDAGFSNIHIYDKPCYEFGIVWEHDWSLPITARIK
ncbi:MAG: hypothetical protein KAS04_06345, partial [Candidatus Aenigmarchaeota archaeon]|nr:hypothetical protein [Candidatus Aenigmarchaeota archaeon]